MENRTAPGVEIQRLSSNWKKLQETLKKDTSRPPKRKASESALQSPRNGVKHRKIDRKPKTIPKQKTAQNSTEMGHGWSNTKKDAPSASLALWAEDNDIPAKDLAAAYGTSLKSTSIPVSGNTTDTINEGLSPTAEAGKYLAIDCEMVGVGETDSALARVSIVNYHGHQIYDSFVQPKEPVTDYRTFVSGITPQLLRSARSLEVVQADVARLLDDKILVGHAVRNDLDALLLGHPRRDIRDTSKHKPFRKLAGGRTPGLKRLAREILGVDIQGGEHSSVEDARATMLLFIREKEEFEREHISRWGSDRRAGGVRTEAAVVGSTSKSKGKKKRAKK